MQLILFDIDGTLLRGGGVGIRSSDAAFFDLFACADAWGGLIPDGKTDPLIFQEIAERVLGRQLTATELTAVCARYLHHFADELANATNFRVLPGVTVLLEQLSTRPKCRLGIETGNLRRAAELKLERAGLRRFFEFGGFACDSADRTEIIRTAIIRASQLTGEAYSPEQVIVIGDAPQDVQAARANGCRVISVATGRHDAKSLAALGPDAVLESLAEVDFVVKLIEGPVES